MTTTLENRTLSGLSFGGILRSETIKLFSLRSTIWCLAIIVVITTGLGFLLAIAFSSPTPLPAPEQQGYWVLMATVGITFSSLVAAVLGALVITGEYSTGMIRSTATSVPKRLPALVAKAIVIGLTTFAVGLVSILAAAILPAGLLPAVGIRPDFGDAGVWWALLGGALYLALLAVLSLSIGAIIRNSAGGIAASLSLLLVLPTILGILAAVTQAEWAQNLGAFLPSAAGARMYSYPASILDQQGGLVLEPWQGLLVLLAWVAVFFTLASVLIKRRDV